MTKIPLPVPVIDEKDPNAPGEGVDRIGVPPSPELLRSFVYREPTGLPSEEDDDDHPHRRRSDRVPRK